MTGQITALVGGEALPVALVGDVKHLEIRLERLSAGRGIVTLLGRSDARGAFSVAGVSSGHYRFRVRVPGAASEDASAELYRAQVDLTAERRDVSPSLPFLLLRPTASGGGPFEWDELQLFTRRRGGNLERSWSLIYQRKPGASPLGPVEEKGGILIEISRDGGRPQVAFAWSSRQAGYLLLPNVEEDEEVRCYVHLQGGPYSAIHRFGAGRGQTPQEVTLVMRESCRISGKLTTEGVETGGRILPVTLTVYDPVDKEPIHSASTLLSREGTFSFAGVPPGLAWIGVSFLSEGPRREPVNAAAWFPIGEYLGEQASKDDVVLRATPESGKALEAEHRRMREYRPRLKEAPAKPSPGKDAA